MKYRRLIVWANNRESREPNLDQEIRNDLDKFYQIWRPRIRRILIRRYFAPEVAERLCNCQRVNFGELLLYNRYFERNKPFHWRWTQPDGTNSRSSITRLHPFRLPHRGSNSLRIGDTPVPPPRWNMNIPSMTYPYAGFPFAFEWDSSTLAPNVLQCGISVIEYRGGYMDFNYGRSFQRDFPVTTFWHKKSDPRNTLEESEQTPSSDNQSNDENNSVNGSQGEDQIEEDQDDYRYYSYDQNDTQQADPENINENLDQDTSYNTVLCTNSFNRVSDLSSDTNRNVKPHNVKCVDTSLANVQAYMMCDSVYTNVELWDMGAQLCLSNNFENFSNDYKTLEHGNMVAANGAEERILGVRTKSFADGLDIKGTIHVPDASASLLAVGHVLAMKEGSYIKILLSLT